MKAKAILVVVAVVLVGWMAGTARADFVKVGSEHVDVTTSHDKGILYNSSTADVLAGGYIENAYVNDDASLHVLDYRYGTYGNSVYYLRAYDTSTLNVSGGEVFYLEAYNDSTLAISGGTVFQHLYAYNDSSVNVSGGSVSQRLYAFDDSTVDITGGDITAGLHAYGTSTVDLSGGSVSSLSAMSTGPVTFHGYDFRATGGLSLVEFDVIDSVPQYEVIGTGLLTGKWRDGTTWITTISTNYSTATILAIPEPATLSLLALGGLAMLRRRKKMGSRHSLERARR